MSDVCPLCARELLSQGMDADRGIARCMGCNALFELSSLKRVGQPGVPPAPPPRARPKIPMRRWATVLDRPGVLELRVRRRGGRAVFNFAFGVLMLGTVYGASQSQLPSEDPAWWLLFVVAFLCVGTGLAYAGLADLIGSTIVTISRGQVVARVGPLPRGRSVTLIASTLQQLYCVTDIVESDYGGPHYYYSVHALLNDGSRRKLAAPFEELDQALWLEQQIEDALGIRDIPITGESSPWGNDRKMSW